MQDASRINRTAQGRIALRVDTWRWSRLAGVVAMCAWACPSAKSAEETVVRLYPSAVVAADTVTLSDVAEIRGESAALAARMELGAAPHVGQAGAIELSQVQSMLARRGVNLSSWVFRGASRCNVQRVAGRGQRGTDESINSGKSAGGSAFATRSHTVRSEIGRNNTSTTQPGDGTEAARAATCGSDTLEAALRQRIATRLASVNGTPVIRFSAALGRTLALSKPTYDFQIVERSERTLGMVSFEVTVLEKGASRQTLPVLAEVSLRKSVVVAARPINRGEIIKPSHLQKAERTFERIEDIGVTEMSSLVGQRARKFIENQGILYSRDVESMPLINANEMVTVLVRRGNLTIRGSAKALESRGLNETVRLRNEMSKDVFTAIVVAEKTAEVRPEAPRPIEPAPPLAAAQEKQR